MVGPTEQFSANQNELKSKPANELGHMLPWCEKKKWKKNLKSHDMLKIMKF